MTPTLSIGTRGDRVTQLQRNLQLLGERVKTTGVYDLETRGAVQRFQQKNQLQIDGKASEEVYNRISREAQPFKAGIRDELTSVPTTEVSGTGVWEGFTAVKLPGVQVVVTARNSASWLGRALTSVDLALQGHDWILIVSDDGSDDQTYAIAAEQTTSATRKIIKRHRRSTSIGAARNRAIGLGAAHVDRYPVIFMLDADDVVISNLIKDLLTPLVLSSSLAVFGSYRKSAPQFPSEDNVLEIASPELQVTGGIKIGTVMFHHSLVPSGGVLFNEELTAHEDDALWLTWFKSGISMLPVPQSVVCSRLVRSGSVSRPQEISKARALVTQWSAARREIMESNFTRPMVSALMLTGKCPERAALARVAVQCFLDQTWTNKQLVIVNHGDYTLATGDPRIKEIKLVRTPEITLGDLRNLSIDHADGEWLIQWDDDDWHHPTRIETQMEKSGRETLVTFLWQIRCNLTKECAFYDFMPDGQHMSILFHQSVRYRYLPLNVREDTEFKRNFRQVEAIDNRVLNHRADPLQYIRFFHGRNIWDEAHVMGGSSSNRDFEKMDGKLELSGYHADRLREIIKLYKSQPDYVEV